MPRKCLTNFLSPNCVNEGVENKLEKETLLGGWMRYKNLLQDGVILEDHSSMQPQDEFGFTYANPHAQVITQATQTQKGSAPKKAQRGGKLTIEEDMPCLMKSKREMLLRKICFA